MKEETVVSKLTFEEELKWLINKYSKENESDTPDFILANYLNNCLSAFNSASKTRTHWHNAEPDEDVEIIK